MYAVGLYVDAPAVKSKLSKYKGQPADVLCAKKEFYKGSPAGVSSERCRLCTSHRIASWNPEKLMCLSRLPIAVSDGVDFIAEDSVEKTVRLMISYGGITPTQFWNALKERLEPPLVKVMINAIPPRKLC